MDGPVGVGGAAAQAVRVLDRPVVRRRPGRRQRRRRGVGAGQADHLVAVADELADDGRADEPGRSRDEYPHKFNVPSQATSVAHP